MTTAAPILPAPRLTVNAHGNADLQARMDAAAPALEALILGRGIDAVAAVRAIRAASVPAAPTLTPDARRDELADTVRVALVAAEAGCPAGVDWHGARRAAETLAGYCGHAHDVFEDASAWQTLMSCVGFYRYGHSDDGAKASRGLDALAVVETGPASLLYPASCQDFEAWCVEHGGSGLSYVGPALAAFHAREGGGLRTAPGSSRPSDRSSD